MDPPKQVVTVKTSVSASANECHFSELGIQRGDRFDIQKEVGQRKKALMYIARCKFQMCSIF